VQSGIDLAVVKITICFDGRRNFYNEEKKEDSNRTRMEHVWIENIEFDGETISGTLVNEPIVVSHLRKGDRVSEKLFCIDDWMYAQNGIAYGGYTVQVLRQQMSFHERDQHDDAWGLKFAEPDVVHLMPREQDQSLRALELVDHPMSVNMEETFRCGIGGSPQLVTDADENGNTMLMSETLAGNYIQVRLLLYAGADPLRRNRIGMSSVDAARILHWPKIIRLFSEI
jgi:uncharacterized protein YegJ (DUF2314 family)